MAGFLLIMA